MFTALTAGIPEAWWWSGLVWSGLVWSGHTRGAMDTCCVCTDTIKFPILFPCKHYNCIECVYRIVKTSPNPSCPKCRRTLTKIEVPPVSSLYVQVCYNAMDPAALREASAYRTRIDSIHAVLGRNASPQLPLKITKIALLRIGHLAFDQPEKCEVLLAANDAYTKAARECERAETRKKAARAKLDDLRDSV
jgi:hypothetical protein